MKRKTIYTHVSDLALKGIVRTANGKTVCVRLMDNGKWQVAVLWKEHWYD